MSRQTKIKHKQHQKRVPAPKQRREPLPISISVKHHLPVSAEGTATDLTVAEVEAATRREALEAHREALEALEVKAEAVKKAELDYLTSRAKERDQDRDQDRSAARERSKEAAKEAIQSMDLGVAARFVRV